MTLKRKPTEVVPPETEADLYDSILAEKSSVRGRIRAAAIKTVLRVVTRFSR